jgi:hypothetical protein
MRNEDSISRVLGPRYWGTEAVLCPVDAISTKLATTGGVGEDASSLVAAEKVSITYPFQGIQSVFTFITTDHR